MRRRYSNRLVFMSFDPGSSRQLVVGPTSAISMLVGTTVAGMAQRLVRAGTVPRHLDRSPAQE
jgi:MFS superfamily sulfate permease-like transporter